MAQPKLFLGASFEDFLEEAVLPWFKDVEKAWVSPLGHIVVVPDRTYSFFLKSKLLLLNKSFAGVYFWTPQDCRRYLAGFLKPSPNILSRENLHLLMSIAAESCITTTDESHQMVASSIMSHPSELIKCVDNVLSVGSDISAIEGDALKPILSEFSELVKSSQLELVQNVDFRLKHFFETPQPVFQNLLLIGFSGSQWPLWNILQASVHASRTATICLSQPRTIAEICDQAWIGSWEEIFQCSANVVSSGIDPSTKPFVTQIQKLESKELNTNQKNIESSSKILFRIGQNLREQALVIFLQAVDFLKDGASRLGIVFPSQGALSREVASLLSEHKIIFNDSLGFTVPKPSLHDLFCKWIDYEKKPGFKTFFPFLKNVFEINELPFPFLKIETTLKKAFNDVLVDDLNVISAYLIQLPNSEAVEIGKWLKDRVTLPQKASLPEWIEIMSPILTGYGLSAYAALLRQRSLGLEKGIVAQFSKDIFLKWILEVVETPRRGRGPFGSHPFAKVHLLTYTQAENQSWSHLILTSQNDTQWPPVFEDSGFFPHQSIQALNAKSMQTGSQGEGHIAVRKDKGLFLSAADQRAIAQRQFYNLIESVDEKVALTAAWSEEKEGTRSLGPNHLLSKLYYVDNGLTLNKSEWDRLSESSSEWIQKSWIGENKTLPEFSHIRQVFEIRRNSQKAFGEYEFSFKERPSKTFILGCKDWGTVLSSPALVWMKTFLGTSDTAFNVDEDRWKLITGEWIHRWLKSGIDSEGKGICLLSSQKQLLQNLERTARSFRKNVEFAFQEASLSLPMWWNAAWEEVLWKARKLVDQLKSLEHWKYAYSEWQLPKGLKLEQEAKTLHLKGRLDLLLSNHDSDFNNREVMIIDFKTGSEKDLTIENIRKGNGVQIVLYGLGLQKLGSKSVSMAFITMDRKESKVISLEDLEVFEDIKSGLFQMQSSGIFGMIEEVRPEFSFGKRFPFAILPIDTDVLKSKWKLTHSFLSHVS
jgi:hypothetical protein